MRFLLPGLIAGTLTMSACATPPSLPSLDLSPEDRAAAESLLRSDSAYSVSDAAMATAVRGADGTPIGLSAYEVPIDAVKAGDMAAFVAMIRLESEGDEGPDGLSSVILAMDAIAAGEYSQARAQLEAGRGQGYADSIIHFVEAWIYALDGNIDRAIEAHRDSDDDLPGLTADLSLAAMLEAAGRTEEALAVYSAMTPTRIEAPEHQFDIKGIMFAHVQMVISRRTLLLRQLGRVEEAKDVYRKLAEAEPEQSAFYAAAMESLETGRGLDDESLDMEGAFARAFADLSHALWQQRIIRGALVGQRLRGLDEQRATFDQLALLVDPDNEVLRENVIALLHEEALFTGAAHVAETAPEPTSGLQLAAAQAHLMSRDDDAARQSVSRALELVEEDDRLAVTAGAVGLHALLGDKPRSLELAEDARELAINDAERASANSLTAEILKQFGRAGEGVPFARTARELDDTHGRRMQLANILGEAGEIEEGLQIIRRERLKRPNDPYMLNTLGYFLILHTDELEEGFRVLYRANALARNDPYIADSLGWAYYKLGHFEDARRLVELSRRELDPQKHWEIEDHLGDIYWHLGREDEAREAWQTALDEFPPYDTAALIREKIENGPSEPAPETKPVPRVSLEDPEVTQRET